MSRILILPVGNRVNDFLQYHVPGNKEVFRSYLETLPKGEPQTLMINAAEGLVLIPMRNVIAIVIQDDEEPKP